MSKMKRIMRVPKEIKGTPWTRFMDMHSGGVRKLNWEYIYIQAPKAKAKVVFYNRFNRNPDRVTCTCCGCDFRVAESPTLRQATSCNRGGSFTLAHYIQQKDILIIPASQIKPEERKGQIPDEGYDWVE